LFNFVFFLLLADELKLLNNLQVQLPGQKNTHANCNWKSSRNENITTKWPKGETKQPSNDTRRSVARSDGRTDGRIMQMAAAGLTDCPPRVSLLRPP